MQLDWDFLFIRKVYSISIGIKKKNLNALARDRPGLSDRAGPRGVVQSVGLFAIFWYSLGPKIG